MAIVNKLKSKPEVIVAQDSVRLWGTIILCVLGFIDLQISCEFPVTKLVSLLLINESLGTLR